LKSNHYWKISHLFETMAAISMYVL